MDTEGCEIWRALAERNWLEGEVSQAKEALKAACGPLLETLVPEFKTNRQKKEKEIEDGILAQIRYQNDLGDEVWRDMHLDPPYEKHIRAPCWSVALSKAIIENGIAHKDRKALPFESYVKGVEDTDSEHEEEEVRRHHRE